MANVAPCRTANVALSFSSWTVKMATSRARRRQNGSLAYLAEVRIKKDGRLVHRESKTFDKRRAATEWAARLEKDLNKPNGVPRRQHQALVDSLRRKAGAGASTLNNELSGCA